MITESGRLKKYDKVIKRLEKKLTQSKALKYYDFEYKEGEKFRIIEKKAEIERAKRLCGYYILETSETEMADDKVEGYYKRLQEVERVFQAFPIIKLALRSKGWVERQEKRERFHLY